MATNISTTPEDPFGLNTEQLQLGSVKQGPDQNVYPVDSEDTIRKLIASKTDNIISGNVTLFEKPQSAKQYTGYVPGLGISLNPDGTYVDMSANTGKQSIPVAGITYGLNNNIEASDIISGNAFNSEYDKRAKFILQYKSEIDKISDSNIIIPDWAEDSFFQYSSIFGQSSNSDPEACIFILKTVEVSYNGAVNVHSEPNSTSKTISFASKGQTFQVCAKKNGYYFSIELPGWISEDKVEILSNDMPDEFLTISPEEMTAAMSSSRYQGASDSLSALDEEYQEQVYNEYIQAQYSNVIAAQSIDLLVENLNGIYGIPYQFPGFVDQKVIGSGGESGVFGMKYADRIISRMPLLMMSPGKVDFLKDYSDEDTLSLIEGLMGGLVSNDDKNLLSSFIKKPGKYYTFAYQSDEYWKYVDSMNSACAIYLGIGDVELDINGYKEKASDFQWKKATNEKFGSWIISSESYVCFYADASSTKDESFSNSTTESQLANKVNSYSDLAKEVRFVLGATTGAKFSLLEEENIGDMQSRIEDIADKYLNGSRLFSDLGKDFAVIAAGGKLVFPEIWSDSEFTQSFDVNIKLRCPCPNPVQWFVDICVPLNHLIAFTMPRTPYGNSTLGTQFENIANSYMSPFLVRAFYRGLFNCDMGIVTSLSITKGKEGSWTLNGLPSEVDVSLTIKDLYNVMAMTSTDTPVTFISNTCFLNYLANACGVSVNVPDMQRSADLYRTIYKRKILNTLTGRNFWNSVEQGIRNKVLDIYTSIFPL